MYGLKSRSGTQIDMLSVKPQILAYMSFYLIYTSDFWNRKIEKSQNRKKKFEVRWGHNVQEYDFKILKIFYVYITIPQK